MFQTMMLLFNESESEEYMEHPRRKWKKKSLFQREGAVVETPDTQCKKAKDSFFFLTFVSRFFQLECLLMILFMLAGIGITKRFVGDKGKINGISFIYMAEFYMLFHSLIHQVSRISKYQGACFDIYSSYQ